MHSIVKNTSRYLSRIWNRQLLVFFFFLLLSASFWLFIAGKEVKEVDMEVKITLVGIPDDIVVTTPPPTTATIRLRDEVFTLMRYKYQEKGIFNVEVNWADIVGASKESHIRVSMAEVLKPVTSRLSGTTTVVNRRPDAYDVYYNHGQSKVVPTHIEGTTNAASDYAIITMTLQPDSVTVYAAPEVLASINSVSTKRFTFNGCTGNHDYPVSFAAPRGVKVEPESGTLHVKADRYVEKSVQVTIRPINCPNGVTLHTFPTKVNVDFQVGSNDYEEITESSFDIVVDYNKLPAAMNAANQSGEALKYILTLSNLPFGVRHPRITPSEVECIIEHE